jgi:hypothetical protein
VVVPPVKEELRLLTCASSAQSRTPYTTGVMVARLMFMIPLVTANKMYTPRILSPLMSTTLQQIMASTVPNIARSLAAYGSLYASGTSLMKMFSSATLHPLAPAYFFVCTSRERERW